METVFSAIEASKEIGRSVSTVSRWAKRLGFTRKIGPCLVLTRKDVAAIKKHWRTHVGNPNFEKS